MNTQNTQNLHEILTGNAYPGRGIILGKTEDGEHSVVAYFIMGRSENSRNRIFSKTEDGIRTEAFDPSKLEDPSLIIYHPVRKVGEDLVVTNGDQTDTVRDFLVKGESFESALQTREFEPDAPHFTSRISGILQADGNYKLSILKSADEKGSACNRNTFSFEALSGVGHFIHTYQQDGNPLPAFSGEPKRVAIPNDFKEFSAMLWNSLNSDNKISLYVRFNNLKTGIVMEKLINKHGGEA